MLSIKRFFGLGLSILAAPCWPLEGTVILSDTFSYSNGVLQIVSSGKWAGHSGTTNQVDVSGGGLNLTGAESQDVSATLEDPPHSATNGVILYSRFKVTFTALPSASGSYFAHFKDAGGGFRGRVWALSNGAGTNAFRLGISSASGSVPAMVTTNDLRLGTNYAVVTRLVLSNAVATLWVNPTAEDDPSISTEPGSTLAITSYAFRQAPGIGVLAIDDLAVGTAFAEVVDPAPPAPVAPPGTPPPANQQPFFATQPLSQVAQQGEAVTFLADAHGAEPLSYQWRFNDADLAGATNRVLTLTNVASAQQGDYRAFVTNPLGTATSVTATLTVNEPLMPPVIRFTNSLENLIRPGDAPTNTFTEQALCPGEKLILHVFASDPEGGEVTLAAFADNLPASASWVFSEMPRTSPSATFTFVPTPADAGSNYVIRLQAFKPGATNFETWTVYVPTASEQQIVLSEFLANPTTSESAPHFNPLRRPTPAPNPSSQDEYVELVNSSDRTVDLLNWTIGDTIQVRHRFAEAFVLQASGAVVVYGGPADGFTPVLPVPAIPASEGSSGLGLNNSGGDAILLRNAQGNLISRVVYASVSANGSWTRYPDLDSAFAFHSAVSTNVVSPGTQPDGRLFEEALKAEPRPISVVVSAEGLNSVLLQWNAEAGRTYSVLRADAVAGPFVPVATGLSFVEGNGRFLDEAAAESAWHFYRVSTP